MSARDEQIIGIHRGCSGTVRVKDWGSHNDLRYEAYCDKCWKCDPNGYGSRKATVEGTAEYFGIGKAVLA